MAKPSPPFSTSTAFHIPLNRRRLLAGLFAATGGVITRDLYAEALTLTPRQTEGPFYPDHLPLDRDNDLVRIGEDGQRAQGRVTEFGGRLLDLDGKPVSDGVVELWQADDNGCYLHSRGELRGRERDSAFQGFGRFRTNEKGEYRFRTIRPAIYTGRTRHFHIAVVKGGKRMLTTQLYFAGEPLNERDMLLNRIRDPEQRLSVIREFEPAAGGDGPLLATWDIVIGHTPEDPKAGGRRGPRERSGRPGPGSR